MRIAHRTPATSWFAMPVSDPVDPAYEAEVQQTTQRAEREYRRAQDRLSAAEKRLVAARRQQARSASRKRIKVHEELVSQRRAELAQYRELMTAPPVIVEDKQIRQRTGNDDHLELGIYKRPRRTLERKA